MRPPARRLFIDSLVAAEWPEECVPAPWPPHPNGYARVTIDGAYRRAHVYACELAHGPKPPDKSDAAHSCGTKTCLNPRHLRWATRAENEADKIPHRRTNRGGERSGSAVLSGVRVRKIRAAYTAGGVSQRQLAEQNGVSLMTINDILKRRTWRHI